MQGRSFVANIPSFELNEPLKRLVKVKDRCEPALFNEAGRAIKKKKPIKFV